MAIGRERLTGLIDVDRLVGRVVDLVRTPSVNPFAGTGGGSDPSGDEGEAAMADRLAAELDDLGGEVGRDEVAPGRPNVWAGFGSEGPTLLLAGHTDTVGVSGFDDPFSGEVRNGRIHGRGSCDMKAALAAYLEVVAVLREADVDLAGRLIVAGLADEEYGLIGSEAFGRRGLPIDHAVLGEPTELAVCTSHLGQLALEITTRGRSVHSSIPEDGVNAVEHMARVIDALGRYRDEILARDPHPLCGTGRLSPSVIRGGEIAAIVPDRCVLEIDRRVTPDESIPSVYVDLRRHLDALAVELPELDYELSPPTWDVGSLDTPIDSPIVAAVCAAAASIGLPAAPVAFPAATDGPNLGVPTVVCGPGSLARAHTIDEYVEVDQVVAATRLYLQVVLDLLTD